MIVVDPTAHKDPTSAIIYSFINSHSHEKSLDTATKERSSGRSQGI